MRSRIVEKLSVGAFVGNHFEPSWRQIGRLGCQEGRRGLARHAKTVSNTSRNDFLTLFAGSAGAPICVSYQFLQCFDDLACMSHHTHACNENTRKCCRFGFQNRSWSIQSSQNEAAAASWGPQGALFEPARAGAAATSSQSRPLRASQGEPSPSAGRPSRARVAGPFSS